MSMLDDAVVMVLAGGVGERLYPLTKDRAKPAVYFGGPYRIIDFTLSNCLNSGLRKIFIALQYKSLSLSRHLRFGWSVVADELGEFVEVLHPQKRVGEHWYQGTADAVYQNLYSIQREEPRHLIVLSGDHVYKMDYARMLRFHLERGAGATLAVLEVPAEEASRFGIMQVDESDRLIGFLEKPKDLPPGQHLASMGIYIFDMSVLVPALEADAPEPTSHDFGKDIIPSLISKVPVYAYRFTDENKKTTKYWRDIGTLDAYYEANMDLCRVNPEFNLYDPGWPLRTHQVQAPPAKFVFADEGRRCGTSLDSMISAGCIISGSSIRGSVLCPNVRVHSFCLVEDSILMPGVRVGRHARIRRAIVDRDVFIPRGAQVGYNEEEDRKRHTVSDSGIVVVTKDDEPFIGPIGEEALRIEAEFDHRGSQ
jgi:glucose-1-phosphate adenylyltransferase